MRMAMDSERLCLPAHSREPYKARGSHEHHWYLYTGMPVQAASDTGTECQWVQVAWTAIRVIIMSARRRKHSPLRLRLLVPLPLRVGGLRLTALV